MTRSVASSRTPAARYLSCPARLLVLTFSRKAAQERRERTARRLGRTPRRPLALTFHSYAYALVRREYVLAGDEPPVLLSGPEQLLEVRRLLRGEAGDGGGRWPGRLGRELAGPAAPGPGHPRLRRRAAGLPAPRDRARAGRAGADRARPAARPGRLGVGRPVPGRLRRPLRPRAGARLRLLRDRPDRRRPAAPPGRPGPGARGLRRDPGRRVPGHRPRAGGDAAPAGRRRPRADRGRRSGPVHLR